MSGRLARRIIAACLAVPAVVATADAAPRLEAERITGAGANAAPRPVALPTTGAGLNAARRPVALQATTMTDWRAAGLDGTGCYWSPRQGGPIHFVAAGGKAMTRVNGRVVILKPRQGARDLFPFTYDAWQSGDLTIRVVDSARIKAMGYETVTTGALLIVSRAGTTSRLHGSLICGS
ncbi:MULTISPECIES: hypothetical protein [unclassified Sphingomonas]|uniref:hypothetical protein n=1 Tax=unclassified Sphingomonas TaxID=196159 RepID=UPI000E723A84|nr:MULTISPECIES: hypothetical protein [unclassified Sphingomonas]RKE42726.1 hypothetical protein C8J39_3558 [Sphingomonas sp. PP-CC-1A-547]TCM00824.1 hypothetical protein C8J41_12019 [Sphingomonas sp. PP-CC-3G-468]